MSLYSTDTKLRAETPWDITAPLCTQDESCSSAWVLDIPWTLSHVTILPTKTAFSKTFVKSYLLLCLFVFFFFWVSWILPNSCFCRELSAFLTSTFFGALHQDKMFSLFLPLPFWFYEMFLSDVRLQRKPPSRKDSEQTHIGDSFSFLRAEDSGCYTCLICSWHWASSKWFNKAPHFLFQS